ncbi:hypothetical protein [Pleomorphochaeta sp. DL1XJH-081]|jgi:hypothetical protein|uniref:hypothetical protein n=1 Tax=Pleomorphochaeta sp. DL1XJH-081 TaxID=3409690 RepID=UPI003BB645B9
MHACFIIRRSKGEPLYLTPFVDPKRAGSWDPDEEIRWHASTGLTAHEKDDALFTLYTQIDRGVDRWIQDARYLPRLLISAGVFLVVYFFFSLAVRDPLPMIDELVIASGLAVGTAIWLSRRDKKSEMAMKRRLEQKQNASRSDFVIEEGISVYEDYLDTCSYLDTLDLADRLALVGDDGPLPELTLQELQDAPWIKQLHGVLLTHMQLRNKLLFSTYKQVMELHKVSGGSEALSARLVKLAMRGDLDLPLLALLVAISK